MKISLLSITCIFFLLTQLSAQEIAIGFNGENNNDPLYVFLEEETPEEHYLLEKQATISPDNFTENPIGLSLSHFKNIDLSRTKNNCSFFKMEEGKIPSALGLELEQAPELSFFEDRLYKIKFYVGEEGTSKKQILKNLSKKFGKAQKNTYTLKDNSTIKEYLWEGYKVNISLLFFKSEGETESVVVVEDELVGKLAIADQENKTFIKEAKLYSDIETILRYK